MRKCFVTLMASLLSCSAAFAFWPEATDSSLEVGVGYRQDRLEWKTSSHFDTSYSDYSSYYSDDTCNGFPQRLRSELKWRDLKIWQIEARGKYVTCDNIYLRANGDYGWINSGKNTDRDFAKFNGNEVELASINGSGYEFSGNESGSSEFARSHSKARGNVYDARIAVGYQFKLCDDSFSIAPLFGYSWHGQEIRDRHLRQSEYNNDFVLGENEDTVARARSNDSSSSSYSSYFETYGSSSDYSSFSYDGDHSKYHTRWNGPFIGFDFDYRFGCSCEWDLFGTYEFHWAEYHAKAKWNLREDLNDGFRHRAKNAYGHIFDIGVKWDFCECWTLALKGEFQWWWADRGHDRAKICHTACGDIKADGFLTIPLKDISWESASVSVDLGMVF